MAEGFDGMTDETKQSMIEAGIRIAERFGVPVVLLAVGIWMLREAAISLHTTVVEPVVKSHVAFLESTQETLHEIGKTQDQQAQTLQELATGQREIQQVLARPPKTEGKN
jgi:hypothetical protein